MASERPIPEEQSDLWFELGREKAARDVAERRARELHKALAAGHGVEDGGLWEDRALAAEAENAELLARAVRAEEERDAAKRLYADATTARDDAEEDARKAEAENVRLSQELEREARAALGQAPGLEIRDIRDEPDREFIRSREADGEER